MGGESTAAWRQFLDDLDARALKRPEFVIVDGAPGLEAALVALWGDELPIQRCTVHKHRNLLAHAPKHMHEELGNDYRDMIYAETAAEVEKRRKAFLRKWRIKCRAVADSLEEAADRLFTFTRPDPTRPDAMESGADHQRHPSAERGVPPPDQNPDRAALRGNRADAPLGSARLRPDHHAQDRRMANPRPAHRAHAS